MLHGALQIHFFLLCRNRFQTVVVLQCQAMFLEGNIQFCVLCSTNWHTALYYWGVPVPVKHVVPFHFENSPVCLRSSINGLTHECLDRLEYDAVHCKSLLLKWKEHYASTFHRFSRNRAWNSQVSRCFSRAQLIFKNRCQWTCNLLNNMQPPVSGWETNKVETEGKAGGA